MSQVKPFDEATMCKAIKCLVKTDPELARLVKKSIMLFLKRQRTGGRRM